MLGNQDINFTAGNIPYPEEKKDQAVRPELVINEADEDSSSLRTSVEDSENETSELKTSSIENSIENRSK